MALRLFLAVLACKQISTDAFSVPPLSSSAVRPRQLNTKLKAIAKDREVELVKLGESLKVGPEKVRELLVSQRSRLNGTEAKAKHIDWLLGVDQRPAREKAKPAKTTTQTQNRSKGKTPVKNNATRPPSPRSSSNEDTTLLSNVEFAKRSDLHPSSKRALAEAGLTSMTEIQVKTYDAALSGKDVLGRARTGTGKTVAFLLPAIERVLMSDQYENGFNVGILVISPTRELASQIANEAEKLLKYHRNMSTQVVFGGTKVARDLARLNRQLPTVLVGTPGRLLDLMQTANVQGRPFSRIVSSTGVIVLDETDQLLDMGFRREIQKILKFLPRINDRQTLLFSATIPKELKEVMAQTMKPDYIEVDCIRDGNDGETSTQTHDHIAQSHVIIRSMDQYVSSVVRVVKEAIKDTSEDHKVVVFFPTARMVSFFADLFNHVVNVPVLELHSKKSQGYRNRVSNQFREASSGILFTSDVSARGVDYPGVSHVIQFGMPSSKEQYVHRLGRTGRAGAKGKGWIVLGPFESLFLEELKHINVPKDGDLVELLNKPELDETDNLMLELLDRVQHRDEILVKSGEGAYQAFLGYYLGQMKRMKMKRKERLVEIANEFSAAMGFRKAPKLTKNMIGKMGLKGIDGLVVSYEEKGGGGGRHRTHNKDRRSKPKQKSRN